MHQGLGTTAGSITEDYEGSGLGRMHTETKQVAIIAGPSLGLPITGRPWNVSSPGTTGEPHSRAANLRFGLGLVVAQ